MRDGLKDFFKELRECLLNELPFLKLLVKYALLEVHSFNSNDDENSNPFIGVILKEGELIA